ncbi:GIY-YIG nuclease family protein [Ruminococcaceae bacterium OttesenSCG-928-A16]|nr:GIY-YIG nuclease family protein [Ruminococcaceae bacterium OttesenSCG-928-A16]
MSVILNEVKDLALEVKMYYVYIVANWNNRVIYTGVTNNIERRIYEHKNKLFDGFTKKYNVNKLVYLEDTTDVQAAIEREKQIKGWKRHKKNALVEKINPTWKDLSTLIK